jgi:hypothetical protein
MDGYRKYRKILGVEFYAGDVHGAVEQVRQRGCCTQERLDLSLKRNLDYLPAVHCIGAAIAFLSGDQVRIPKWADRFYLGWLFRCLSAPSRCIPRYWAARKLLPLMVRYRSKLPGTAGEEAA